LGASGTSLSRIIGPQPVHIVMKDMVTNEYYFDMLIANKCLSPWWESVIQTGYPPVPTYRARSRGSTWGDIAFYSARSHKPLVTEQFQRRVGRHGSWHPTSPARRLEHFTTFVWEVVYKGGGDQSLSHPALDEVEGHRMLADRGSHCGDCIAHSAFVVKSNTLSLLGRITKPTLRDLSKPLCVCPTVLLQNLPDPKSDVVTVRSITGGAGSPAVKSDGETSPDAEADAVEVGNTGESPEPNADTPEPSPVESGDPARARQKLTDDVDILSKLAHDVERISTE
ncbi:hypothetical protein FOZ63_006535, partial [Perkinsus olseni]